MADRQFEKPNLCTLSTAIMVNALKSNSVAKTRDNGASVWNFG